MSPITPLHRYSREAASFNTALEPTANSRHRCVEDRDGIVGHTRSIVATAHAAVAQL